MQRANRGKRAFDDVQVAHIRQLYAGGMSQAGIAREFQVNTQTIGRILRGETYIQGAAEDIRARVAERYRQPVVPGEDDLEGQRRLVERIKAAPTGSGVIGQPPAPATPSNTLDPLAARLCYRMLGGWPAGYTPSEEDEILVGAKPPPTQPNQGDV